MYTSDDGSASSVATYNAWRGRSVDSILWFASRGNWSDFDASVPDDIKNFPGIKVLALPTHPDSLGWGGLDEVAAGSHNAEWQSYGAYLVSAGLNNNRTVLRIGWEMNGNWFDWSATTSGTYGDRRQTYKNAFINIVNSIRAGGATAVQFDWCVNKGNQGGSLPTDAWGSYPGDAYVDIIGLDIYDFWNASFTDAEFATVSAETPSLNDVSAYCSAHGKKMALDEWGVIHDPNGGNDNPFFIQKMWNWLNANASLIAYESYFDDKGNPDTYLHKLSPPDGTGWNPNASALYKSLWGSTATIPAAPTGLTATGGNAQVTLSWTASSGASSYSIFRGTSAGGESTTASASGITATSYSSTGLTNGTPYYFKIKAVNAAGSSGYSNEASATPLASGSQPLPNGTYTLAPANATGLRLQATGTTDGSNVNVGTASSSNTQQWILTSTNGNIYRLSPASATSECLDVNGQLTASGTNVQTWTYLGQLNQQWALNSATGGYTLTPQHATSQRLNNTGATDGSNVNQLTSNGNTAQTWNIVAVSATPPAAPSGLTATAGNTQVSLSWTASSGATSYKVFRGTSAGGESTTAIATGITGTTYTNTGLTNGTAYYYKVAAVSAGGTSGNSNEAHATPIASSANVHSGTWSAKGVIPTTAAYVSLYQEPTCAQNTVYTASVWVKGSGNFNIKILDGNWTQISQTTFTATSTWTQKSVTFTTPNTSNPAVVFYLTDAGGGGTLYIDDTFMGVSGGTNMLSNAGFESGNTVWTVGSSVWSVVQNP